MAIGKSKLSDMDFGSFKDTIDKNIETDKASDRFDRQLQAYKEAGVKLDAANNSISAAKDSLNEATTAFNEVVDDANAAVQHLFETFEKFHAFTFKAKLSSDDLNKLSELQKQIVVGGTQLLEEHRNETKKILSSHFYNMPNKMAQNEGVWLSNIWMKTLLWIFLPCFIFTISTIVVWIVLKCK